MKVMPGVTWHRVIGLFSLLCLLLGAASLWHVHAEEQQRVALIMTIDGAIGPATYDYFQRGLDKAEATDAELIVVQLDTPGGLDASMREMISDMLASDVPVVMYVSPSGARAASAGTYLLYGSHVAAMAPATHLGSATPVQIGGGGLPGLGGQDESDEETSAADEADSEASDEADTDGDAAVEEGDAQEERRRGDTAMERKVLEDAVSYIRSLAERHDRNADWAEQAVREAVNLTANEALERDVVEVVASDVTTLLSDIDGRTVVMDGGERELATEGLSLERFDPDWRTELLSLITNPNVAYFLMIIGFYGIIFELANPGALVPGTIGIICLLLALFAFQVLPINYAGLALILAGLVMIVGEALMPSFGVLGVGGIAAFVIGSVILMDADNLSISLPMIAGVALLAAGLMLWTLTRFMGLRKRRPRTGQEELIGSPAVVIEDFHDNKGKVRLHGEIWTARADTALRRGDDVVVTAIDGLTVTVVPSGDQHPAQHSA
ncbi:NfeD family protein [Aidingimonas lacisalsi]|uniref:NfeD family protein n=1 Tax=Aidingimonas lacisalsi TaxID=2604086 RepID=UPI001F277AFD|nr:nodulation protein NfeD [Aidingimonas lacisalsi]